jgi:hypothetical protein
MGKLMAAKRTRQNVGQVQNGNTGKGFGRIHEISLNSVW